MHTAAAGPRVTSTKCRAQLRGGANAGQSGLDDRFQLEAKPRRQRSLMRGPLRTDGRPHRGSSISRATFSSMGEMDKNVYEGDLLSETGPFLDTGAACRLYALFGSAALLWGHGCPMQNFVSGTVTVRLFTGAIYVAAKIRDAVRPLERIIR